LSRHKRLPRLAPLLIKPTSTKRTLQTIEQQRAVMRMLASAYKGEPRGKPYEIMRDGKRWLVNPPRGPT
jgi:hypothetical protein